MVSNELLCVHRGETKWQDRCSTESLRGLWSECGEVGGQAERGVALFRVERRGTADLGLGSTSTRVQGRDREKRAVLSRKAQRVEHYSSLG
jgi:hypothetical protein